MKKFGFFLLLLFLFPTVTFAEDLKLNSLSILNGELSLPFDPLNTSYTIFLEKEIDTVAFQYEVENDVEVHIENNNHLQNNSIVTVTLTNKKDSVDYTFQILKDEEESKSVFLEEKEEVNNPFMMQYKNYIIPLFCLFLVFLSYRVVFHHKK